MKTKNHSTTHPRRIAVVTAGRSDFGIYLPILQAIRTTPGLDLHLIATGTHLSLTHGYTLRSMKATGFPPHARIPCLPETDTPEAVAIAAGTAQAGFARAYRRLNPDLILLLGDRFEMFAAASAAVPFNIPIAHIHGGEITLGAIDDRYRHAISKLSHLHFTAAKPFAKRLIQMGEEPWRVHVCGAPALDRLRTIRQLSAREFGRQLGMSMSPAPLLVTFHPATLEWQEAGKQAGELLAAIEETGQPALFTIPNSDPGFAAIERALRRRLPANPHWTLRDNLGPELYFNAMRHAAAMVGNSSSGLIEAPSFRLPVVNIGIRQAGRLRARNVIDTPCERHAIARAIRRAISAPFRAGLRTMANPYFQPNAAKRIVRRIRHVPLNQRLLLRPFHEISNAHS
jgi:UDP-hydrolysing UDP-N-acetyl-D-glucosamine 2-epimerase